MATRPIRILTLASLFIVGGCVVVTGAHRAPATQSAKPAQGPKKQAGKPRQPAKPAKPGKPKPGKPKPGTDHDPKPDKPGPKPEPKPGKPEPKPEPKPDPKPEPPPPAPDPDVPPKRTQMVVPVRVPFAEAVARIDDLIVKTTSQSWQTVSAPGAVTRIEVKYKVWRDPIQASYDDQTLKVRVGVHYAADVRASTKNPLGGRIWITRGTSWGTKAEPQDLSARFQARFRVEDDFSVRADVELVDLDHGKAPSGDVCVQAIAKLCVSKESVAPLVRKNLERQIVPRIEKALDQADREVERALNVKKHAQKLWIALQQPQPVQQPGQADCPGEIGAVCKLPAWLVVRPETVGLAPPRMDGKYLRVDLGVSGQLSVNLGDRPQIKPRPLPKLTPVSGPEGFAVRARLRLSTTLLSAELNQLLKGKSFGDSAAPRLQIAGVSLGHSADPAHPRRVVVRVGVRGPLEAEVELQGELDWNTAKGELSLKDVDYTLSTADQALKKLSAANYAALRALLADRARWQVGTRTAALGKAITDALDRVWRGHLDVDGELSKVHVESFTLEADALAVDVILAGKLDVTLEP